MKKKTSTWNKGRQCYNPTNIDSWVRLYNFFLQRARIIYQQFVFLIAREITEIRRGTKRVGAQPMIFRIQQGKDFQLPPNNFLAKKRKWIFKPLATTCYISIRPVAPSSKHCATVSAFIAAWVCFIALYWNLRHLILKNIVDNQCYS